MTSSRERTLAFILLTVIVLLAGGFGVLQLVFKPMRDRDASIALLKTEIEKKRDEIRKIQAEKPKLERWRQMSLPADSDLASREYEKFLSDLLRQSNFAAGAFSVTSKKDSKSGPTLGVKKEPIYTKLTYTVTTHGELPSLLAFLERFYRTGLLHQIRNLSIQRPLTVSPGQKPNDLDINLTVEALVLQGAQNRPFLAPVDQQLIVMDVVNNLRRAPGLALIPTVAGPAGPNGARRLAADPRKYQDILGKNIFFGPPPPPPPPTKAPPVEVVKTPVDRTDVTQFVYLTDITHGDAKTEAFFYDRYNNRKMRLQVSAGFDSFRIREGSGDSGVAGKVVKIDDRDLVFSVGDKYYTVHVGQNLKEAMARPLKAEEMKELGLKPLKPVKEEAPPPTKKPEPGPDDEKKEEAKADEKPKEPEPEEK